ncbi:5-formyltetrahydrofolate cyclo-ligase [Candidatus Dojkabacteria bacterium]|nr:5-formyltetrahydrofolate cyclo-ligase [Candidatus Dojkabacteria bacterium]
MKNDLRIKAKIIRNEIENTKNKSRAIQNKVLDFISDYSKGDKIFSYIEKKKEVEISPVFRDFRHLGYKIYVPTYTDQKWRICQYENSDCLGEGPHGIPQPTKINQFYDTPTKASFKEDDIAIVPGLLFTKEGNRLGYGGGTFDIYLQNFKGTKVGICFKEQIVNHLPIEHHDIIMDIVITD